MEGPATSRLLDPADPTLGSHPRCRLELPDRPTRYAVRHGGRDFMLSDPETLIGRHPCCAIVIDSPAVAGCHARLVVCSGGVIVEAVDSQARIFRNGAPVCGSALVSPGDCLRIGDQEITMIGDSEPAPHPPEDPPAGEASQPTLQAAGDLAAAALRAGRVDAAEQQLSGVLQEVLLAAEAHAVVSTITAESAAHYAIELALGSGRPGWFNYVIRLYLGLRRPLPGHISRALQALCRQIHGIDTSLLRKYQGALEGGAGAGPEYRFAAKRVRELISAAEAAP
jgi:hypothetical protein